MVDLAKMVSSDLSSKNPKISNTKSSIHQISIPNLPIRINEISLASSSSCSAYEQYLKLPELSKLWNSKEFPNWKNESLLKPALQGLEITFRLISHVLSDPRPYVNRREWKRRLESLTTHQVELISIICEDEEKDDSKTRGTIPIVDLNTSNDVLSRDGNMSTEIWKISGETYVVNNKTSDSSLLPRLATWQKSEDIASKIMFSIECEMKRCPYTLGLGEPNLTGKPNLNYDLICKPLNLHSLKTNFDQKKKKNYENQNLFTIHQILESWIQTSKKVIKRIEERIEDEDLGQASSDCWLMERIWKLLTEIEELNILMDPDDFLKLKNELSIKVSSESESEKLFCFRSKGLMKIMKLSKDLKQKVPKILGVEVDIKGGPRIQEEVMKVYHNHEKGEEEKIHLLQALQGIESGMKKFFFSYNQLIMIMMGSLEVRGNRSINSVESLSQIFLEPTYLPSLDAAKTFLGDFWRYYY